MRRSVQGNPGGLAVLTLVSRGHLDVYAPVARYWPEFAATGKEAVEVRHLLSHTSGVSGLDQPAAVEDLYDWERLTRRMAAQAPWWEPGTASGYDLLSFGHLLGEVLRRITERTLKDFVAEDLAGRLGADFQIGASGRDERRIALVVLPLPFDLTAMDPASPIVRTLTGPQIDASIANTAAWRAADIGAGNGNGNARSVARVLAPIALDGTANGIHLLSAEAIKTIFDRQSDGVDLVLGLPLRFGIGFELRVAGTITAIWLKSDFSGAVLILECADETEATAALNTLPIVINDATAFVLTEICRSALGCTRAPPNAFDGAGQTSH
jgi:CubicO group peptidase (beta-lactamase class C family)